jgi:hypothetical protein
LILLAILLSFVVSIATGIVTVTLLQQAPQGVTQTINRVVQQTIEKVVPDYTPEKTQTVVVKEDELVIDAVAKARANLFPIFENVDSKDSFADAYSVGNGIFITKGEGFDQTKKYIIKNGKLSFPIKVLSISSNGLAVLATDSEDKASKDFIKSVFGKDSDIKAGQTVIAISQNNIYKDTVQNIVSKDSKIKDGTVTDRVSMVQLGNSIPSYLSGASVSNLDGIIIGFVTSVINADGTIKNQVTGIDTISKFIADSQKNPTAVAPAKTPSNPLPAAVADALQP